VRVRRWWLKTNLHSLIWQSRVPNNPRFAMITWISEPKRPSARERRKPFAPGKRERDTKKYAKRAATSFSPSREVFRRWC
jgi:hypothetical protein